MRRARGKIRVLTTACFAALMLLAFLPAILPGASPHINTIKATGPINPIIADYIAKSIDESGKDGAACIVILLDTPGGLDLSMRSIIQSIEDSPVPVVVYVSPSGARAASAGVFITLVAHVAAMAPGTNIGAAHPVAMGGEKMDPVMVKKVENDASAYVKSLANKHGRNADWAEKAVRLSISSTADEALKEKVIDLIAANLDELIAAIDGRKVTLAKGEVTLKLKGLPITALDMGLRHRILNTLSDPNLSYILMMIGMWGLFFELSNPGAVFPGVIGGISIILAFVSFQTLPINYAGVLLLILALIFFIAEVYVTSHGVLALGGIAAMVFGSIMLFDSNLPFYSVSWKIIAPVTLATAGFFALAAYLAVRVRISRPATGFEGLEGETGVVSDRIAPHGKISIHGEYWDAESDEQIEAGEKVRIVGKEGFTLKVKKK
jgi:membrane-bound serine protease (ClpP class)